MFDAPTVMAMDALLAAIMGGFALFEGWSQRAARHLVPWGVANLLASFGMAILLSNGHRPDILLPVIANTLLVAFAGLCRSAARICNGRSADLRFTALLSAVWLMVALVAATFNPAYDRMGVGQGVCAVLLLATAWEFHRGGAVKLESRRAAVWLFAVHGSVVVVRALATALLTPSRDGVIAVPHIDIFGVEAMVFVGAGSFVLLALAKERIAVEVTSDVRAAHAEADAARAFLDNLVVGLPSVVYRGVMDPTGTYLPLYLSDNVRRITGWTFDALRTPSQYRSLVHPDDAANLDAQRSTVHFTGAATTDYRLRRPDGSWIWLRDRMRTAGTLPDGSRDIIGHLSDMTPEREAAAQAINAAKLATLGEMAGGLAQELEQPIGSIAAAAEQAAEVLRRRRDPGDRPLLQRLERMVAQGQRAREIVAHLRAFAQHETGPAMPVDVTEAVHRALRLMKFGLGLAEIEVSLDLPDELPPVLAQSVALEQVLVNILANARDALTADHLHERRIHVAASADPGSGMVCVTVSDTGGGLSDDILPRVFEPFFTTKTHAKASGLGLSISYGIVRSFNGSIAAGNGRDGAEFVIKLPQAPQPAAAG